MLFLQMLLPGEDTFDIQIFCATNILGFGSSLTGFPK